MQGSIRKQGKASWQITIHLGRDTDGKKLRKFVTVKGTKAQAQRQLRKVLSALDSGLPVDTGKLTVAAFLERWIRDYAVPNTRPLTAQRYESDVRLHIVPAIGRLQLDKLAPADVQAMEAKLLTSGKSARSVQHVHVVLKEALKHAMRWGLTYRNVCDGVDPPKVRRREVQPPSADGVLNILDLAKRTPYHPAYTFMAFTGCRRGEALGLRWSDVDLEQEVASIVQSLQRQKGQGLVFTSPKSAKSRRSISLDSDTVSLLREHRGSQLLAKAELGDMYTDMGLVFPGPLGRPLDPSVLTRTFEKLVKEAGMPGTRLHDLRHFHATQLLQAGRHHKEVAERLGHSSVLITLDTYSHVGPTLQREAANAFADAMRRARADRGPQS